MPSVVFLPIPPDRIVPSSEKPLPGDLVIRAVPNASAFAHHHAFLVTKWPDADAIVGGPYQSYGYALRQAKVIADARMMVWRDHARPGHPEQLEDVSEHD